MSTPLHLFAESLRGLARSSSAEAAERCWVERRLEEHGWRGLDEVGASTDPAVVPLLEEIDTLIAHALGRLPHLGRSARAEHVRTFRVPALERLHHATAAALVAHQFGTAGLVTILTDVAAPLGRRYRAFVLLARLHEPATWPVFARYLVPEAHYAFLGTATEATRFYPRNRPASLLVGLFGAIRADRHLRAFVGPRLLGSLFVLADPVAVPLYRELAVAGHTHGDPRRCEVTHALVMLRRFSGEILPNSKFADRTVALGRWLDDAEVVLRDDRDRLHPAVLL
jgi:hypothetical protein